MADSLANAANLDINTTQPKPLRGLILRGRKKIETVRCELPGGNGRIITVNVEDYDKEKHGPKVAADQLPKRASKKKAPKKKAKAADK